MRIITELPLGHILNISPQANWKLGKSHHCASLFLEGQVGSENCCCVMNSKGSICL